MLFRRALRRLLFLLCLGLGGALFSATLVRFAPGYGADERQLDPRWSAQSVEALSQKQVLHEGLASFYFHYVLALTHGDLGESDSLKRPVQELLRQRLPVTSNSVVRGLGVAWLAAALLASLGLASRSWLYEASSTAFSSLLLSLPSAVVAMLAVHLRTPVFCAIAVVVFPRLHRYVRRARSAGCRTAAPGSFRGVLRYRLRRCDSHRSPVRFTGPGTTRLAGGAQPGLAPHRQSDLRCLSGDARSQFAR